MPEAPQPVRPAPAESAPPEHARRPAPASTPNPTAAPVGAPALHDLFTGGVSTDAVGHVPPPKNKRRRRAGGWIALGLVLVLVGGAVGGGYAVWTTYESKIRSFMGWAAPTDYAAGEATGETTVTIAAGDTGSTISASLFSAGVTKTSGAFYTMLVKSGLNPTFYPGVYKLQKQMSASAALTALQDPASKMQNTTQLREGLTVDQSIAIISQTMNIPLDQLQTAVKTPADYGVTASSLEGWLFPATYTFDPAATPAAIIKTMVDRTTQALDKAQVPAADRQRTLTIASIIQREARFEADFYKVSRVIQNRLSPSNQETFGKLQMDSTAQYGYKEMHDGTVSTSAEALANDNPWNTYIHPGLPIGPIANPGDVAIDAAMHPAAGDWLYFVTVNLNTGETVFTNNLADHNKAVAQWQSWCKENPDSGC
ncbi:MAG: endolytic transglycosylase MltG [Actinobacteria bacterium]|nr:endolytic transglycosylase MltG [Actinomycetota bacterium]